MANQRIFLVLTLFVGVSLAIEEIRNFHDKTAPNKWSFFERSWNRKSKDSTKRYQLPERVTAVESDDTDDYHRLCHETHSERVRESISVRNIEYLPVQPRSRETKCSTEVDDSEMYMVGSEAHQICTVKKSVPYFCATITKERTVFYKHPTLPLYQRRQETYSSGCECVYANDL